MRNCQQLEMKAKNGKSRYGIRQLELMRQFYKIFPIVQTLSAQLNWSQYKLYKELKEIEK
jgi:predicted CoA-binding protein